MSKVLFDRVCDIYDSENIETVAYSFNDKTMLIRFKTSAEYHYYSVNRETFFGIVCAESVGKAVNAIVSSKLFPFERII
jgi:hypothetical protein